MNKTFLISFVLLLLFALTFSITKKEKTFLVVSVQEPNKIFVDFNENNHIDMDELTYISDIEVFSTNPTEEQKKKAEKLNITEEEALGIGHFAQIFAEELLMGQQVLVVSNKNNANYNTVMLEKQNYIDIFNNSPFALRNGKPIKEKEFQNVVQNVQKLNFKRLNTTNNKYHTLSCEKGLLAKKSTIVASKNLPENAKPCSFCYSKQKKNTNTNTNKKYKEFEGFKEPSITYQNDKIKVFFTDFTTILKPNNSCTIDICKEIVRQINSAQKTVDIAIYGYGEIPAITTAIKNAQSRGVQFRLITDITDNNSNIYDKTFLLKNIIKNNTSDYGKKTTQSLLMHNKFFIFDNEKVLTGSFNIAPNDMSGINCNIGALISSKKIAAIYTQEFNQMFNLNHFHNGKTQINNKTNLGIGESIMSVYFSPKDTPMDSIVIPMIKSAKKYIYIPTFLITHQELADNLIAARKRGVDVKIILDASNANNKKSVCNYLRNNGIKVKVENYAGKMHAKTIVIDDKYTILGSMNFTNSGNIKNDENMLVISNSKIALETKVFFNLIWNKIPDKWLTQTPRAESPQSIGSCFDGIDNDFDGNIDLKDSGCSYYLKQQSTNTK